MPIEILVRTILAGNSKSEYLLHENVASEKKLPVSEKGSSFIQEVVGPLFEGLSLSFLDSK